MLSFKARRITADNNVTEAGLAVAIKYQCSSSRLGDRNSLSRLAISMSKYSINIGNALITALAGVSAAQRASVAGYLANRDFFHAGFRHFLEVATEYDNRRATMRKTRSRMFRVVDESMDMSN